jgi:hypothetical protein
VSTPMLLLMWVMELMTLGASRLRFGPSHRRSSAHPAGLSAMVSTRNKKPRFVLFLNSPVTMPSCCFVAGSSQVA